MKRIVRRFFPRLVSRYRRFRYRLVNKPKITYSHSGEDILIAYVISNSTKSVRFVDIGCAHPVFDNNTYSMYRKGHYGVNVDARTEVKKLYSLIRPRDRFINSIISDSSDSKSADFFVNSDDPHVSSVSADWAVGNLDSRKRLESRHLPTSTLAEVFRASWAFLGFDTPEKRNAAVLVLSIDVEGQDLPVLKSNDWVAFKPDIVCIETFGTGNIDDLMQGEIYQFLSKRGYQLTALTPLSSIFELKIDSS